MMKIQIGKVNLEVEIVRDVKDASVFYCDIKNEEIAGHAVWNTKYNAPMVSYLKKGEEVKIERRPKKARVTKLTGEDLDNTRAWFKKIYKMYSAALKAGKQQSTVTQDDEIPGQMSLFDIDSKKEDVGHNKVPDQEVIIESWIPMSDAELENAMFGGE
jgi:hypothetical protein